MPIVAEITQCTGLTASKRPVSLVAAQQPLTWDQLKARFESGNPALKADALNVDEARAQEVTAYLRPNPQFTGATDATQIVPNKGVWQPLKGTDFVPTISYLHEREHKRELRLQSAQEGTRIMASQHEDLKRDLGFTLGDFFDVWGEPLTTTDVAGYTGTVWVRIISPTENILWTTTIDPRTIPLTEHEQISLAVGSPVNPVPKYQFTY